MPTFQPILSAKLFSTEEGVTERNLQAINFPKAVSIKYDGWRLVEYQGQMVGRSLKQPRNILFNALMSEFVAAAAEAGYRGLDGEIIIGDPNDPNAMQNTTSVLNSYYGDISNLKFLLFDSYQYPDLPFMERHGLLREAVRLLDDRFPWLTLVEQTVVHNLQDLLSYEDEVLAQGYEGIMVRSVSAPYKFGRSTLRQQYLMALKRFAVGEALALEYYEQLENCNEATINELGYTARSSHQENMYPKDTLGTILCFDVEFPDLFFVGGGRGVTDAWRLDIWRNPQNYQWRVMQYHYQDIGIKTRPRLARWKNWRSWQDLDPGLAEQYLRFADQYVKQDPDSISALQPEYRPTL